MLTFVGQHAAWAPLLVAALAFCESLAFISLLFPASTALVAIGALIGAGALSFVPIWIAAAVGAALGDWLSYWLGQTFEAPISRMWPLSRHPDLLARARVHREVRHCGDFHRPLLRTVAGGGAAGCRHPGNGVVAVPDRQCHLGLHLGGGAAGAGCLWIRLCDPVVGILKLTGR